MFKVLGNMINLNLDLMEVGVHNEGADEDKDEDGRETHFEKTEDFPPGSTGVLLKQRVSHFCLNILRQRKTHVPTSANLRAGCSAYCIWDTQKISIR